MNYKVTVDNSIKALLAWSKRKGYIEDYEMETE